LNFETIYRVHIIRVTIINYFLLLVNKNEIIFFIFFFSFNKRREMDCILVIKKIFLGIFKKAKKIFF
jgi:hypothetical protein